MGRETTVDYETIPTSTFKEKKVRVAYFVRLGLGRKKMSTPWRDYIKNLRLDTAYPELHTISRLNQATARPWDVAGVRVMIAYAEQTPVEQHKQLAKVRR